VIENLDITEDYDVVSVDMDEEDRESIYSFSEGEDGQERLSEMLNDDPLETFLVIIEEKPPSWRRQNPLTKEQEICKHDWYKKDKVTKEEICTVCTFLISIGCGMMCTQCKLTICTTCMRGKYQESPKSSGSTTTLSTVQQPQQVYLQKDELIKELIAYVEFLLKENSELKKENVKLKEQVLVKDLQADFEELSLKGA
jgi:hypothetical protein